MSTTVIQASEKQVTGTVVDAKNALDVNVLAGIISGKITPQGLTTAGKVTMLSIDASAWYAAPVTPLANRNNITIQNQSATDSMLWNYDNTAPSTAGFKVGPGGSRSIAITGAIPVYVRMVASSQVVCVEELA